MTVTFEDVATGLSGKQQFQIDWVNALGEVSVTGNSILCTDLLNRGRRYSLIDEDQFRIMEQDLKSILKSCKCRKRHFGAAIFFWRDGTSSLFTGNFFEDIWFGSHKEEDLLRIEFPPDFQSPPSVLDKMAWEQYWKDRDLSEHYQAWNQKKMATKEIIAGRKF